MTGDFENVPAITAAAVGAIGDELTFTFPEVLEVIDLCCTHEIAVLGLELFEVRPAGCYTKKLSAYDKEMNVGPNNFEGWSEYVRRNNALASEFVRINPTGDGHVYVLTTASWKEFGDIQKLRQQ